MTDRGQAVPGRPSRQAAEHLRNRRLGLSPRGTAIAGPGVVIEGILGADGPGLPGHSLALWLAERFNQNFDAYDRAIDTVYNSSHVGGPQLHHLLDGQHSIWGAFQSVRDVSVDDGFLSEIAQALEHLARDTMSVSGVNPFFSLTPDQFDRIGSAAASFGMSKAFLADALTVNGPELLGGSLALVGALLLGRHEDPDQLSRLSGGCLLAAAASANPLLTPIAAAGMAYALVRSDTKRAIVVQAGKGALVSGATLLTAAIVGGPAWVGCLAGFVAGLAVNQLVNDPAAALERARSLIAPATEVFGQAGPSLRAIEPQNG